MMTIDQAIAILEAEQVLQHVGCEGPDPCIGGTWHTYVKEALEVLEKDGGNWNYLYGEMVKAIQETRVNNTTGVRDMTERYIAAMAAEFKNMRDEAGRMPLDAATANFDIQFGRLDGIREAIEAFIRVAKRDDPRFDAYRFRAWCGLEG